MNGNSYAYNRGDPEFVVRMGTVRETKKPHPCDDSHSGATIAETRRPSRATIYSPYPRAPSTRGQGGGSDSVDISQMAQDHELLHAEPLVPVATKRIEGVGAVALTTSVTSEISPATAVGELEEPMILVAR